MPYEKGRNSVVLQDRIRRRHGQLGRNKHPDWDSWWPPIKADPAVRFFEDKRHWIIHHGPSQVGQTHGASTVHDSFQYEAGTEAVSTVRRHLERVRDIILAAEAKFGLSPDSFQK